MILILKEFKLYYLQIILIIFVQLNLFGQDTIKLKSTFEPSLNIQLGYIPKTYPIAPKTSHCLSSSVGIMWKLNGKDQWHQYYRFPKIGFELYFSDFGNPKELGYSIAIVPTLELKTKHISKYFFAKYGYGISYSNKPYNLETNPKNYYIGSNITAMVSLSFLLKKRITKNLVLSGGLSAFHFSNGHTQLPNVGLNYVVANFGLQFDRKKEHSVSNYKTAKNKLSYSVKLGLGRHEFGETEKAVGGPKYNSYHLSTWVNKPYNNIHIWQAGVTLAFYNSFYDYIISQELYNEKQKQKACTGIAFIGHDFVLGKFSICTQLGIYFYNPFFLKQKKIQSDDINIGDKLEAINTNRFGLQYYPLKKRNTLNKINKQISIGVFIKANLFKADLFEYSLGYTF